MIRTDDAVAEVTKLYQSGLTGRQVAEELGIPLGSVYEWLRWAGVRRRTSRGQRPGMGDRLDHRAMDRTVELYRSGLSSHEIATLLGIHPSTVLYRLQMAGVERRSRGESCRLVHERRRNNGKEN